MGCKERDFAAPSLSDYLKQLLQEKGLERSRVVRMADLNETFGYQIFTGSRNPSRNMGLQIAFAMALTLKETNRALTAAGVSVLNCKDRRDAIIIFCIDRGCSLQKVNDELTASLVEYLASLDRDDSYRVERVLKLSDVETTELVYFEGSGGGSLGPFVRKCINASVQIGGAYERLFAAQRAGLRYEHLPRIVDSRRMGDEFCVVMEYVEDETLEALVGRLGATLDYACELFGALCDAAAELHAGFAMAGERPVPVIHRDLKPSNIIVSGVRYAADAGMTFSSLVIIDLGIARVWRDGADADTVKFGTRPYAPPEQFGFGQTSVRSDIYALGALLFLCLTGTDPKPGQNMREQCEACDVPAPLTDAVCMAMALDPAKRFASAAALGHAARAAYGLYLPGTGSIRVTGPSMAQVAPQMTISSVRQPQDVSPAAPCRKSLLSRIPEPIGRIWNGMIYAATLLLLVGSHFAVFHPTGANQSYPTLLLIIEYFLFVDGLMMLMHFALLDKRRLRRRFALLDSYRGKKLAKLWLKALGVLLLCMIVIVAVANAAGVVDTSATKRKGPHWGPLQLRLASLNAVHLGSDLVVPVLPRGRAVLLGGFRGKRGAIVGTQVGNVGRDGLAPAAKATPTTAAGTPAPGVIGAGAIEALAALDAGDGGGPTGIDAGIPGGDGKVIALTCHGGTGEVVVDAARPLVNERVVIGIAGIGVARRSVDGGVGVICLAIGVIATHAGTRELLGGSGLVGLELSQFGGIFLLGLRLRLIAELLCLRQRVLGILLLTLELRLGLLELGFVLLELGLHLVKLFDLVDA